MSPNSKDGALPFMRPMPRFLWKRQRDCHAIRESARETSRRSANQLFLRLNGRTPNVADYHIVRKSQHFIRSPARRERAAVTGIVRPSAFAALRLIIRSNLVGCSIGISPGLVPFKILST